MSTVKSLVAGTTIFAAVVTGGGIMAFHDSFLAAFQETFAGTPPGSVAAAARDLVANIRHRVRSGEPIRVVLDVCAASDEGWTGDSDPFGTIKCGETYVVRYLSDKKSWEASGFNEGASGSVTSTAGEGDATGNAFVIWGARFDFNADGHVFSGGERVGHLELPTGKQ
ncbi:MAG TPA: hypothetical protein VGO52_01000 [Hyphomonadaceae bacterium]|nr:hypothetical protein [Hyphomonadaceae bacterium]